MTQHHSPRVTFANPNNAAARSSSSPSSSSATSAPPSRGAQRSPQTPASTTKRPRACCEHCGQHPSRFQSPLSPSDAFQPAYAAPVQYAWGPNPPAFHPAFMSTGFPMPTPATAARAGLPVPVPRLSHYVPAPVLHDLGAGPSPLFGWESVIPLPHSYGAPKYLKRVKPDYRRFCFSVGKAEKPYAALPGGPLEGMPTWMSSMLV